MEEEEEEEEVEIMCVAERGIMIRRERKRFCLLWLLEGIEKEKEEEEKEEEE